MPRYTQEDVDSAIAAVAEGRSICKAAFEWGVLRATIYNRINGAINRKEAYNPF
jgi:transposase-like protein